MLLAFEFANHASFAPAPEGTHRISFVASAQKDHPEQLRTAEGYDAPLLPAVGLYGANASGKSNALHALALMRAFVLDSARGIRPTSPLAIRPFALGGGDHASRFDLHFLLDGVRYRYGFEVTRQAFTREWLHAWPKGVRQVWYEREGASKSTLRKGSHWTGEWSSIVAATRDNALYLSVAAAMGHPLADPLYRFFDAMSPVQGCHLKQTETPPSASPLFNPTKRTIIETFLRAADLGVCDYKVVQRRQIYLEGASSPHVDWSSGVDTGGPSIVAQVKESVEGDGDPRTLVLAHRGKDGQLFWLERGEESLGTLTLLDLLHHTLLVLDSGSVMIADELASMLHPHLVRELLLLFLSQESNPRGAQLLFSTHDTRLMELLRRDALVRVEKSYDGASTLAAFSEFRLPKKADLQQVYLDGKVGGVPRTESLVAAWQRATEAREAG